MNIHPDAAIEILKSSNDAIVVVDEGGDIVLANKSAELLFGYEAGELVGQQVEILMPDAMRRGHAKHRQRFGKKPRARPLVSGLSLKGLRKDGRVFDAEIALTPVESKNGLLVSSTIRDISADDTSEAYFRNVLESAPDAMVIIDHHGRIAVVNGQAEKMFGHTRKQMLGQEIEMLLPGAIRDRHISHRARFAANPTLRPMGTDLDLRGLRRDGSEFPVEISLSPFTSASGAFISSVIRDVTSRKEMEDELIEARHEAERANKANTAFLAAASHDLRQPVQALSLLNGALRRTVHDSLALEMIASQQNSLDAMTNLLNSLLDISRLDAGKVEPEYEEFRIQRLVDRLFAEFSRQAKHKGLRFKADSCDTIVRSDPNLLSEIIQNFVSNAIRYTDKGSVKLSCRSTEGKFWIDVTDSGIGIDPLRIDEIFLEFHQIKTPGAENEGFGLGLAIVKRLADLLGHEISVVSEPGNGSTFSIQLPVVSGKPKDRIDAIAAEPAADSPTVSGMIILIEDDLNVANAWGLLLEAEGYRVATAASAKEAAAVARHLDAAPDLIISDFHLLHNSTGLEAVAMIREEFDRNIPAFIVTGDTSKMVQDARSTENCIIMNKPVNTDQLLQGAAKAIATGKVSDD
ncbi:MAG: PAS domain S-box protein [Proteobacteria bacterium]|nr:PAS domain S-box protein [Pseudomonadota bacterium]MDA0995134.1 PAS domain S-box protein [Pseudomonadota bacterium]